MRHVFELAKRLYTCILYITESLKISERDSDVVGYRQRIELVPIFYVIRMFFFAQDFLNVIRDLISSASCLSNVVHSNKVTTKSIIISFEGIFANFLRL